MTASRQTLRLSLALALLGARPARAAFESRDAGTSSGQFLKLGADARAAGMGQAARAASEDASAVYWNPAGLAGLQHRHALVSHAALYQNVFYDFLAYAQPVPSILGGRRRDLRPNQLGAFGVGLLYLNAGKISEVDNTGTPTGDSFTPQDAAIMAAWGLSLTRHLDVGLGGKFISSRIKGSAAGGAFDLGARLRLRVGEVPYTLAAGVHNLGGRLKFIQQEDPLPLTLSVGQSVRPLKNWVLAVDVVAPQDNAPYPALGTEYRYAFDPGASAALRLGWERRVSPSDLDGLAGITVGAGLSFSRLGADYAWSPVGLLGDAHRFSLNYRF